MDRAWKGVEPYDLKGKLRIDAFVTKPVQVLSNKAFDNGAIPGSHFNGIYLSTPLGLAVPGVAADLYYYDQRREGARLLGAAGLEKRKTLGARIYGRSNHWDYDLEGAYQFGSFGNEDIRAWAVMFEGGYNMPSLPLTPRIGVRGNIFSGDKNANDGRRGTFVAPFPKAPIYNNSDAAWFNFSNMIDIFPMLSVRRSSATSRNTAASPATPRSSCRTASRRRPRRRWRFGPRATRASPGPWAWRPSARSPCA